jgi:hypothetical protein
MIGDPNVKTDYTSSSKRAFVNHNASRPQREKRSANESSGFNSADPKSRLIMEIPKNKVPSGVLAQREIVCRESIAQSAETRIKRSSEVSQVDCSVMGAPFRGVSETAASLHHGRVEGPANVQPIAFKTDFETPRHPILHTGLSYAPPVYECPAVAGNRTRRCSQNCVQRQVQLSSFLASSKPGSSFEGGVHL